MPILCNDKSQISTPPNELGDGLCDHVWKNPLRLTSFKESNRWLRVENKFAKRGKNGIWKSPNPPKPFDELHLCDDKWEGKRLDRMPCEGEKRSTGHSKSPCEK